MEIVVLRKTLTENSTISDVYVDGVFQCYAIEDKDRGMHSDWDIEKIKSTKVYAKTAIPYGRYKLINSFSNRFKTYLPEIVGVPGFAGIRIHPGNTSADSEGCILPGVTKAKDFVGSSKIAFGELFKKIKAVEKTEKIYITIKKG